MKSIFFILLATASFQVFASNEEAGALAFKNAENSIIDILRSTDPRLDSRNIKFQYSEVVEGFGICCNTSKLVLVTDSKSNEVLGRFVVTVGNTNNVEYQQGKLKTSISKDQPIVIMASYHCLSSAEAIAKDLFPKLDKVEDKNSHYAPSYIYNVKVGEKLLATLNISPVECALNSVTFEN